jgi:hypothetical protein
MLYHGQIIFKEYTVHREGGRKFADMQCIRADTLTLKKELLQHKGLLQKC